MSGLCRWSGAVCLLLIGCAGQQARVRVTEANLVIPTYGVGPAAPHPPLFKTRVYPYAMQTRLLHRRSERRYRAVTLENEFIRVVVLPRFGGKVYAAFDKTDEDADFIYHNRVIKPGLVGLRGAWLSGGIEWNFPSLGHSTNTFDRVPYQIVKHDDGSVSCVVGTTEWVRRMRWVESLEQLHLAADLTPRSAMLNWTLAQIYWHQRGNLSRSIAYYREALKISPRDGQLYIELDHLLATEGLHGARRSLLLDAPPEVQEYQGVKLRQTLFFIQQGQPSRALKILTNNRFYPWEGWSEAYEVYLIALHQRIDQYMATGSFKEAAADLAAAMRFPENLGSGRPAQPDHRRERFRLGRCFREQGDLAAAKRQWHRLLAGPARLASPSLVYRIKALRALGRGAAAADLLNRGILHWETKFARDDAPRATYLYRLGLLYILDEQRDLARKILQRALVKDPAHHWARLELERVD